MYCTAKTVKDNCDVLECRQCNFAAGKVMAKPVSSYEAHAWQIFREQCFQLFLVEIKLLGREHGAADIWWPGPAALLAPLGLIVMIDGEGH